MKLPKIPANCFGIAVPVEVRCSKNRRDMADVLSAVDSEYNAENNIVVGEKILWFKEPKVKKVVKSEIAEEADTCWIDDAGEPGSKERIAALQKFYANNTEVSPFVSTDDECADGLIQHFVDGTFTNGKITPMDKFLHDYIKDAAQDIWNS